MTYDEAMERFGHDALGAHTLTGTLHYDDERVALGTMTYKHVSLEKSLDEVKKGIGKLNINLKLIPDVDGTPKIAQLVGYNLEDIVVKGAWDGPARLHIEGELEESGERFDVRLTDILP